LHRSKPAVWQPAAAKLPRCERSFRYQNDADGGRGSPATFDRASYRLDLAKSRVIRGGLIVHIVRVAHYAGRKYQKPEPQGLGLFHLKIKYPCVAGSIPPRATKF
jgi:hypothetical protein